MGQVAVLDYDRAAVYIYDLPPDTQDTGEAIDRFVTMKGHSNCDWFLSKDGTKVPIVVNGMARSQF